jgi:hypothetical protein
MHCGRLSSRMSLPKRKGTCNDFAISADLTRDLIFRELTTSIPNPPPYSLFHSLYSFNPPMLYPNFLNRSRNHILQLREMHCTLFSEIATNRLRFPRAKSNILCGSRPGKFRIAFRRASLNSSSLLPLRHITPPQSSR